MADGTSTPDARGVRDATLQVDGLVAAYGPVRALDGVSLTVEGGSITAVLGANGAGKTTLLRTISGFVRPLAGSVRASGRDLTGRAPEDVIRAGVAHIPEGRGVIAELTVEENLRLGALWRRDGGDRAAALAEAYELFPPLAERRGRQASTLSGGERQMLVIGRALMARPTILLLDEPSLGLAPKITRQIMTLIGGLRERHGLTVLLVEQNARSALGIADRGVVLGHGRVAAAADAATLASDEALRHHYLGF